MASPTGRRLCELVGPGAEREHQALAVDPGSQAA
jgi:hypothetical protein